MALLMPLVCQIYGRIRNASTIVLDGTLLKVLCVKSTLSLITVVQSASFEHFPSLIPNYVEENKSFLSLH